MGVHWPQISWYCAFLSTLKVNSIVVVNLLNILQTAEVQDLSFLRLLADECQQTYGINHGPTLDPNQPTTYWIIFPSTPFGMLFFLLIRMVSLYMRKVYLLELHRETELSRLRWDELTWVTTKMLRFKINNSKNSFRIKDCWGIRVEINFNTKTL